MSDKAVLETSTAIESAMDDFALRAKVKNLEQKVSVLEAHKEALINDIKILEDRHEAINAMAKAIQAMTSTK